MNTKFYEQDVQRIFKENECWYEWWVNTDGSIEIKVEWGDWKHDHLFLKYIMRKNHYRHIDEVVTEEDGSDTYSAIHTFKYGAWKKNQPH